MKKKKWFRKLFRRRFTVSLLIVLQAALVIFFIFSRSKASQVFGQVLTLLSAVIVLYIIGRDSAKEYKTTWIFLILLFPLLGGLLYLVVRLQSSNKRITVPLESAINKTLPLFDLPGEAYKKAKETVGRHFPQIHYLHKYAGFPVYENTETHHYSPGEKLIDVLLPELEKAERYIFLEFFIVQEGIMWDSILEILRRKVADGVSVRLIYDDVGCFLTLPTDFKDKLNSMGIEVTVFNPFRPFLTVNQNNRDHRKLVVIDGKVAFTGGMNLADEYINALEKHGHWMDSAVMVKGKAAWSFTLMFLQMWEAHNQTGEDFLDYYPYQEEWDIESDGFVLPYADIPQDGENVGENVYLQILNQATDYVYINTPYLIVDEKVQTALELSAKRGVDVRIITPHRYDKKLVHMTTQSYYRDLIKAGVRIYEYSLGFLHSKSFVSDDAVATVGSTNLDYRSLYLSFEAGVWLWKTKAVTELKNDYLATLKDCREITIEDTRKNIFVTLFQDFLRLFAPLM